jgi:D-amino-acid dehydrogenase
MKILVLGAGVIGVTTAWYLRQAGHDVTVIDRQPSPAMETSFANAGQISPGMSAPWAAPDTPRKAITWLLMRHSPLVVWPLLDPALIEWVVRFLGNCNDAAYRRNKGRMVRQAAAADRDTIVLSALGVPFELLDRNGCIVQEPGLAETTHKFVGGLKLPGDETGDARLFTERLAKLAEQSGVVFRMGTNIVRLHAEGGRIASVETDQGNITADAYVLALGSYSPLLLRPLGIKLPVYPVKGYSITVPVANALAAPVSTVMDETFKVAITRLGDRIRVGGTAELGGWSTRLRIPRRATLVHSLTDLFPAAADPAEASFWTGLRPMTPDGPPLIGPTKFNNLWLNTGHGTLGWTMACGSGALLSDLLSGRVPNIQFDDLGLSRFQM